jgi:hypothetical protein
MLLEKECSPFTTFPLPGGRDKKERKLYASKAGRIG